MVPSYFKMCLLNFAREFYTTTTNFWMHMLNIQVTSKTEKPVVGQAEIRDEAVLV